MLEGQAGREGEKQENRRIVHVRDLILGAGIPKICIPVVAADIEELQKQTVHILENRPDLVEWRADYYAEVEKPGRLEEALTILRKQLGNTPILFTFRTKEEGGERSLLPEAYVRLNERAAETQMADLVDIEWNRGKELAQKLIHAVQVRGCRAVCSFHDFQKTPESEQLLRILCRMQEIGADITKAAVMPCSRRDVLRLLDVSIRMEEQYADRPYITMAMGRLGMITRMAGALDGSAVTFASSGHASAPGQIDARLMAEILPLLQG